MSSKELKDLYTLVVENKTYLIQKIPCLCCSKLNKRCSYYNLKKKIEKYYSKLYMREEELAITMHDLFCRYISDGRCT